MNGRDEGYNTARSFMETSTILGGSLRNGVVIANKRARLRLNSSFNSGQHSSENTGNSGNNFEDSFPPQQDSDPDNEDDNEDIADAFPKNGMPDTTIWSRFEQYLQTRSLVIAPEFTKDEENAIQLMAQLRRMQASLESYKGMMEWYFRASGLLHTHEVMSTHRQYISREILLKRLTKRYNLEGNKTNIEREITLPSSRSRAKMILNDAKWCIQSLLTDPKISDDDYLFFDNDPFLSPPKDNRVIGDINTGRAYLRTYKKRITDPKTQVLLPVIFYIDGASTGQFVDLPITAMKFTLGIFNRKARDKPHMWRTLGYVPKIVKQKSKGRRIWLESGHVDGVIDTEGMDDGEGNEEAATAVHAQDLHSMCNISSRDSFAFITQ